MIWWVILGLIIIFITGLIISIKSIRGLIKEHDFIYEYREKFVELANLYQERRSLNQNLYSWLISKSIKAQNTLGLLGTIHYTGSYLRPIQIPNYEMISNTIPQLRTGSVQSNELLLCDDLMIRFLGRQEDLIEQAQKSVKNPFIWFQFGVQFYLVFPLHLLNWFGVISSRSVNSAIANKLFKALSGLIALVILISGLVSIIVGWDKSIEILQKLFK